MNDLNIFDAYGRIRNLTDEATTAAIEALPDEQRKALFACVEAVTASAAGQDRVAAARADVRRKEAVFDAALERDHKANPAATHKSALAAVIDANAGRKSDAAKPNKKSKLALAEADAALTEARRELTFATDELRKLEAKSGAAIDAWRLCQTTPSDADVRRQYLAASNAERARRVAQGLPAETPKAVPNHQSEIDRVFAARGKVQNRMPQFLGKR